MEGQGLPRPSELLSPFLDVDVDDEGRGVAHAHTVAGDAYVPASQFQVGAILELDDGRYVPGVNVEHVDWTRILCAERNALGTAYSYGLPDTNKLYLSCPTDPEGTPCGACRQMLAELAPNLTLWMDRHDAPPEQASLSTLLPGSFRGRALLQDE
jgi:homotetrameric cytidine deaminase